MTPRMSIRMLPRLIAFTLLWTTIGFVPVITLAQPIDATPPESPPRQGNPGPGSTGPFPEPGPGPSIPAPSIPAPANPAPGNPTPDTTDELWGAIAFTADGSYTSVWRQPSKAEAQANVATRCARMGRGACEVIAFPGRLCGALANVQNGRYRASYTGGGLTSPEAQKAAIERCNADRRSGNRCSLRTVVCGDGR
jgi:hypothetical protein